MFKAIVLRKVNFEETSVITTLISEESYYSLMIKGAKRKNSGKLELSEPLTLIEFMKTESKTLPTLTEGRVLDSYKELKDNLEKLTISSVMLEYALSLKDLSEDTKNIYDLLYQSLNELKESNDPEYILFKFEIILLSYLGSSLRIEYLKEIYHASDELINSLESLISSNESINRNLLRNFFINYYEREIGIKLKSKKLYLDILN